MRELYYDVVVIGGGLAGVCAALGATHAGAKTLLIDRNPYLGGSATNSGIVGFCGLFADTPPQRIVTGAVDSILAELKAHGEGVRPVMDDFGRAWITYDLENLKVALDLVMIGSNIDVLLHTTLVQVETSQDQRRIKRLSCSDECGIIRVSGKNYVDASGNANLAFLAGVGTVLGERGRLQAATLVMKIGGYDSKVTYSADAVEMALHKARQSGFSLLTKMRGQFWSTKQNGILSISIANYPLKAIDGVSLTKAEQESRQIAHEYIRAFRAFLPGMENCYLVQSGPEIGIRESRRIICERMLTIQEAESAIRTEDSIAKAGWPFENHDDPSWTSTYKFIKNNSFFTIPITCIRSRKITNLWCAGKIIGVDHETQSSVRVMGTCMATGQAAGVAAAIVTGNTSDQFRLVQAELIKQGAMPC